jgi:hypothetical protein
MGEARYNVDTSPPSLTFGAKLGLYKNYFFTVAIYTSE